LLRFYVNMEHWWNDTDRGHCTALRKTYPCATCLPLIPHGLAWD